MTTTFAFQDPGEGIAEAEVRSILVSVGDEVQEGQEVLIVETDKAAFDLSSPHSGRVSAIPISEGDIIHVGDVLLRFADSPTDASVEARRARDEADNGKARPAAQRNVEDDEHGAVKVRGRRGQPVIPASPATRRIARELGVALANVTPSGEHGRVLPQDVRAAAQTREPATNTSEQPRGQPPERPEERGTDQPRLRGFEDQGAVERVPLRSVRRTTARRMARAWHEVARVTHYDEADITELERLRRDLSSALAEDAGVTISLTAMLAKALARTLSAFPRFNASFDADAEELSLKRFINLGVAVDTAQGLVVPVLHDLRGMSLGRIARLLKERSETAHAGHLTRQEVTGGTFTLTNVGPLGGTALTPMVNHPEVAILGVARAHLTQRVSGTLDDFSVGVRLVLPLSLSFDHRVIDGAQAARFMSHLVEGLQDTRRFVVSV